MRSDPLSRLILVDDELVKGKVFLGCLCQPHGLTYICLDVSFDWDELLGDRFFLLQGIGSIIGIAVSIVLGSALDGSVPLPMVDLLHQLHFLLLADEVLEIRHAFNSLACLHPPQLYAQ